MILNFQFSYFHLLLFGGLEHSTSWWEMVADRLCSYSQQLGSEEEKKGSGSRSQDLLQGHSSVPQLLPTRHCLLTVPPPPNLCRSIETKHEHMGLWKHSRSKLQIPSICHCAFPCWKFMGHSCITLLGNSDGLDLFLLRALWMLVNRFFDSH